MGGHGGGVTMHPFGKGALLAEHRNRFGLQQQIRPGLHGVDSWLSWEGSDLSPTHVGIAPPSPALYVPLLFLGSSNTSRTHCMP
jgi:hypothetical protein